MHANPGPFSKSDLPIAGDVVYHLQMRPEDLAPDIIIVGDPGRAKAIVDENFRGMLEFCHEHRGLYTATGDWKGQRVTVTTSGMGTGSLEIVLGELTVLNEIDFDTRERKSKYPELNIIRVGTSGGLREQTPLGALVVTEIAVGLDNTGLFYDVPSDGEALVLEGVVENVLRSCTKNPLKVAPYTARADKKIVAALERACAERQFTHITGITISNSGFFGPQGRDIMRMPIQFPDIDGAFARAESGVDGLHFENMEMESSFLLRWAAAMGYRAGSVCVAIANRRAETFDFDYGTKVGHAVEAAFAALRDVRRAA